MPAAKRDRGSSKVWNCTQSPKHVPYGNRAVPLNHPKPHIGEQQKRIDNNLPDSCLLELADKLDTPVRGCSGPEGIRVPYGTLASIRDGMYGRWVKRDLFDERVPWDKDLRLDLKSKPAGGRPASGQTVTSSMPSSSPVASELDQTDFQRSLRQPVHAP